LAAELARSTGASRPTALLAGACHWRVGFARRRATTLVTAHASERQLLLVPGCLAKCLPTHTTEVPAARVAESATAAAEHRRAFHPYHHLSAHLRGRPT